MHRSFVLACLGAALACSQRPTTATPADATPPADSTSPETADAAAQRELAAWIREHYEKQEVRIPMRDGAQLFTAIYRPRDLSSPRPIMLTRTPYAVDPYGPDAMMEKLGPSEKLARRQWIFVYQDVRGRFMSDGQFVDMRPHRKNKGPKDIDESTDTYDTIAWLLDNVEGHNGRVGQWGISYPGFYAAAGMIDAHPALKAVSPQAPIADWFFDDFHHHGAFFLPHAFNFFAFFGVPREGHTKTWPPRFEHGTPDGYAFFLQLGPLTNANARYFQGEIPFWNQLVAHPSYDDFWKARNILPHLHDVAPAVMTVGGWFDAEDLYGPLHVYRAIEDQDEDAFNVLVMGPWRHGGWARDDGRRLGDIDFGSDTSRFYRAKIEAPFFDHHLTDGPAVDLPEAYAFETGANRWRRFEAWPPPDLKKRRLFARADGHLVFDEAPDTRRAADTWRSDPARPVPYTVAITTGMRKEYMVEDQRFAARRPDVVVYQTEPLSKPVTIAGPIEARLWVSTTGRDADFVVKLVDVLPGDAKMPGSDGAEVDMGDYQMMVRSEVIRARFRNGYDAPEPMKPGAITQIVLPLQDVLHTFGPGHRIMVQIQSTWFPLVDRNPQTWVDNIFEAKTGDFVAQTHKIHRDRQHPTQLVVNVLSAPTLDGRTVTTTTHPE